MAKRCKWRIFACSCAIMSFLLCAVFVLSHFGFLNLPYGKGSEDFNSRSYGQSGFAHGSTGTIVYTDGDGADCAVFSDFKADICDIPVSTPTYVLFTVNVSIEAEKIALIMQNGTFISEMNDSGKNGDLIAGDSVFSVKIKLYCGERKNASYCAEYSGQKSDTFEICFYEEITDYQYEEYARLLSEAFSLESFDAVAEYISNSSVVESYFISNNKITFTTYSGMTGVYEGATYRESGIKDISSAACPANTMTSIYDSPASRVNTMSGIKGGGEYAVPPEKGIDYSAASIALVMCDFIPADDMKGADAAVARPFRHNGFDYDDFADAGEILTGLTGGLVTVKDDSAASLDFMKTLDKYKLVLIDSHGALSDIMNTRFDVFDERPYILTGTVYSAREMWSSADWQAGRIIVCGTSLISGSGYVAVGSGFFDKYYESEALEGSIFFLGSCYSTYDDSIATSLVKKGARVVYGFTDRVSVNYCNSMLFETLVNSMVLSAYSSGMSIDSAKSIYGSRDPYANVKCEMKIYGDPDCIIACKKESESVTRDIVMVLDRSGSMSGTPLEELKKAASAFISDMIAESGVGIAAYGDEADIISELDGSTDSKLESIAGLRIDGGTNMEAGLRAAHSMLKKSDAQERIIVLMSDGRPNRGLTGDDIKKYAASLKNEGIDIYTIGFFENISRSDKERAQELLESIASGGCHYEAYDSESFAALFKNIADDINS